MQVHYERRPGIRGIIALVLTGRDHLPLLVLLAGLLTVLVACSTEVHKGAGGDTEPATHWEPTTRTMPDAGSGAQESTTRNPRAGWDYVALGDSLAAGVGARRGYVARYAQYLRRDTGVRLRVINLGVSGETSSQLLHALRKDPSMRKALGGAEVITFNIGINDLGWAGRSYESGTCGGPHNEACLREAVKTFRGNWDEIIGEISSLRSTDDTIIRAAGLGYTPRARGAFESYLSEANRHIASSTEEVGIPHTEVHLGQRRISPDTVHPNDEGYAVISSRLRKLGYEPLSPR